MFLNDGPMGPYRTNCAFDETKRREQETFIPGLINVLEMRYYQKIIKIVWGLGISPENPIPSVVGVALQLPDHHLFPMLLESMFISRHNPYL